MDAEHAAKRRFVIGGTDISAIIGCNPWRSALDVYMDKTGMSEPTPDNEPMYWGRSLEPIIADRYARDHGVKLAEPGFLVHPDASKPWWGGSPDRRVVGVPLGLEIKTAGWRARDKWGTPGTAEVPEHYLVQAAWYCPLLDVEAMDVPVLFSGSEYAEYTVKRDLELEALLGEAAEKFVRDHIDARLPPEMREPASADRYIRARFPKNVKPLVEADAVTTALLAELRDARGALAKAEKVEALLTAKVKAAIGDADGMTSELGRVTWKQAAGRASLDRAALEKDYPDLVRKYTRLGTGSRRFVVPRDWADKEEE
jgi:putative phage-type endonuclease